MSPTGCWPKALILSRSYSGRIAATLNAARKTLIDRSRSIEEPDHIGIDQLGNILKTPKESENDRIVIPKKKELEISLLPKEYYKMPFVDFDHNDCIEVSLTNQSQPLFTKYENYIGIKDKQTRSHWRPNKNLLQLMLEEPRTNKYPLKVYSRSFQYSKIVLPQTAFEIAVSEIKSIDDVEDVFDAIHSTLPRFSRTNIIHGLLMKLPTSPLLDILVKYVALRIDEFTISDIQQFIGVLIQNNKPGWPLLISRFDKINDRYSFMLKSGIPIKLEMLQGYIDTKDFQSAFECIKNLIHTEFVCPPSSVVGAYLDLVSSTASSLKAKFGSQKILFNAYSLPVAYTLKVKGVLNSDIVKTILHWTTKSEYPWFINYLKASPDYQMVMYKSAFDILNAYNDELTRYGKNKIGNSISLTNFINHMEVKSFDDKAKQLIALMYARFGSPLGVKLWLDQLDGECSESLKMKLVKGLESRGKHSFLDDELPGRSGTYRNEVIDYIEKL